MGSRIGGRRHTVGPPSDGAMTPPLTATFQQQPGGKDADGQRADDCNIRRDDPSPTALASAGWRQLLRSPRRPFRDPDREGLCQHHAPRHGEHSEAISRYVRAVMGMASLRLQCRRSAAEFPVTVKMLRPIMRPRQTPCASTRATGPRRPESWDRSPSISARRSAHFANLRGPQRSLPTSATR